VILTPHPLLVSWLWESRAVPLLPLWAVRPVQSLSACTRVHFTFIFCSNSELSVWKHSSQLQTSTLQARTDINTLRTGDADLRF